MERFSCDVTVISGDRALDALSEFAGKRLLVVTDPFLRNSPKIQWVLEAAKPGEAAFFDGVGPEPTMGQAVEGVKLLKKTEAELVVAVGGGNVMNCAKAMACFSGKEVSLTVIPTAIGCLAETTHWVVLAHDRRRHTLRDRRMGPAMVILDTAFFQGRTDREIGEGGFALLAGSLEAYTAKNGGILSDLHAKEAFATGWAALPAAFSGRPLAEKKIQMASVMASLACGQAGQGLCAALCGSLETVFHLPQGRLAAMLMPAVIDCNSHAAGRKYTELARAAGMGGSNEAIGVRNLKNGLIRLRRELGMPGTLAQAGIPPKTVWSNVRRIVELTLEDPECRNNPVPVDDYVVRRILEEVTGRY